jgi:SAM-dependent methyltransferase
MFETRTLGIPQSYYGIDTQPQRLAAVLKFTDPSERILDLGTGRGAYVKLLTTMGIETVGVDQYYYPEWRLNAGLYVQAAASTLPFSNHQFHTTIAFEVLEHCSNPEGVLREIARCTSKRLILSIPNCDLNNALRRHDLALAHWTDVTHCNFFTKQSICILLQKCGYQITHLTDCYPIRPNDYFWNAVRLPLIIRVSMKLLFQRLRLVETYWSSILIAANVPNRTTK